MSERTAQFDKLRASFRLQDRTALVLRLASVRIWRRWPLIFYVGSFAGLGAGAYCGIARVLPATLGMTVINYEPQGYARAIGESLFQGMAGGLMWGLWTAVFLALGWVLFRGPGEVWNRNRLAVNIAFGILGGLAGGIGVASEVWFMFDRTSLFKIGWVTSPTTPSIGECVQRTYCLFYPGLGPAFGAGMGLAVAMLYTRSNWDKCLRPYTTPQGVVLEHIVSVRKAGVEAVKVSALYSLTTGVLLFASAVLIASYLPEPVNHVAGSQGVMLRALGETFAIWIGNIGAVFGVAMALLIMRVGVSIPPYTD
jgi:hypothetical protein